MGTHSGIRNEPEKRNVRITESSIIANIEWVWWGYDLPVYIK